MILLLARFPICLCLGLGSDAKHDIANGAYMLGCETSDGTLLLQVVEDLMGSLFGHCIDLIVALWTLVGDLVGVPLAIGKEVDAQVALRCVPCPVANELQAVISDTVLEGKAVFDELAVFGVVGIHLVDQVDRLVADLTVDTSNGGLVIGSHVFWHQQAILTIVDEVDVDALANLHRKIQEAGESVRNADADEIFFDGKLSPRKRRSRSRLGT